MKFTPLWFSSRKFLRLHESLILKTGVFVFVFTLWAPFRHNIVYPRLAINSFAACSPHSKYDRRNPCSKINGTVCSKIDGHAVQPFPHLVMPFTTLFGWVGGGGATFHLIKKFLKFGCLLNAVSGGSLKHSLRYVF